MSTQIRKVQVLCIPADNSKWKILWIPLTNTTDPIRFPPGSKQAKLKHVPHVLPVNGVYRAKHRLFETTVKGKSTEELNGVWFLNVYTSAKDNPQSALPQNKYFSNEGLKKTIVLGDAYIFRLTSRKATPNGRAEYADIKHLESCIESGPLKNLIAELKSQDDKDYQAYQADLDQHREKLMDERGERDAKAYKAALGKAALGSIPGSLRQYEDLADSVRRFQVEE